MYWVNKNCHNSKKEIIIEHHKNKINKNIITHSFYSLTYLFYLHNPFKKNEILKIGLIFNFKF